MLIDSGWHSCIARMAETVGEQLLTSVVPPHKDDNSNDVPPLMTGSYVVKPAYMTQTHHQQALRKRKSIYIVPLQHKYSPLSAQTWITQLYLQTTPCLPLRRKHSPDGTTPSSFHHCTIVR